MDDSDPQNITLPVTMLALAAAAAIVLVPYWFIHHRLGWRSLFRLTAVVAALVAFACAFPQPSIVVVVLTAGGFVGWFFGSAFGLKGPAARAAGIVVAVLSVVYLMMANIP